MATSPNYGWSEPDNSSLVKNGAADIRTLGDAIDTSLWSSGYGQAGKNKIINGDFRINQRNFTSTTTTQTFGFDRFGLATGGADGTGTYSAQTFTAGAAPVAGYEAINYARLVTAAQSANDVFTHLYQNIEDVRTFAGQTVTVSFWAKAATGTPSVSIRLAQSFGSGGSSSVNHWSSAIPITTSWARYSYTFTLGSMSGKTIGTGSYVNALISVSSGSAAYGGLNPITIQNNTFDIWGVQVEAGSQMTPFQTASGGSPQAELAMCQRYYYRTVAGGAYTVLGLAATTSTTAGTGHLQLPVSMRTTPTSIDYSALGFILPSNNTTYAISSASLNTTLSNGSMLGVDFVVATTTSSVLGRFSINNSATGYLGCSAEL